MEKKEKKPSLTELSEKLEEDDKEWIEDNIVNYLCDSLLANGEGLGFTRNWEQS